MSQNTLVVADGTGLDVLNRINNALNTLVTNNSGSSAPSTTYGSMTWFDTTNTKLKLRNGANTEWRQIPVLSVNSDLGIGNNNPLAKIHATGSSTYGTIYAEHPGNTSYGTAIQVATTGGTDDPAISWENYNGGSPVRYSISCTDDGGLAFNSGGHYGSFGTYRAKFDSSGRFVIGATSPQVYAGSLYPYFQVVGTTAEQTSIASSRFANDGTSPQVRLAKSRGTSIGTQTIVQNGDTLGVVSFWGSDGSGFALAAGVYGVSDGTPVSGTSMPGALSFRTTPNGSISPVENAKIDKSGVFYMNSGYGSAGAAYGCRAWVNFNGTGTVAIRGSGNVSSITDNGNGDYTLNFTTAMPDANYAVSGIGSREQGPQPQSVMVALSSSSAYLSKTASAVQIYSSDTDSLVLFDTFDMNVAIFR